MDVVETQMCCGCGACAYLAPEHLEMTDSLAYGRRPRRIDESTATVDGDRAMREALTVCPGVSLEHTFDEKLPGLVTELVPGWGPILELWEGYATDPEVRYAGSSGGAASALAIYALEKAGLHGLLHIVPRSDHPYLNHTVLSTTRDAIVQATGSRYAPASPCDSLHLIEDAPAPCVFIGKPCDVAAVEKAHLQSDDECRFRLWTRHGPIGLSSLLLDQRIR